MIPACLASWSLSLLPLSIYDMEMTSRHFQPLLDIVRKDRPSIRDPKYGEITAAPEAQRYCEHSFGSWQKTVAGGPIVYVELARVNIQKREVGIIRKTELWVSTHNAANGPFDAASSMIRFLLRVNKSPTVNRFVGNYRPGSPHPDQPEFFGIWPHSIDQGILVQEDCTVQLIAMVGSTFPQNQMVAGRIMAYRMTNASKEAVEVVRQAM